MSMFTQSVCAIGFAAIVAGCSQQEESYDPIAPEPVYNKYGAVMSDEVGCAEGDESCQPREYKIPKDEPQGGGDGGGESKG